jgi:hypothetical protein
VDRSRQKLLDPNRMSLIAEVAAVADVYSAISSDRPYRAAMPPDRVAAVLVEMAGAHLNREIVGHLRRLGPKYPVGHWVQMVEGPRPGWRGVVTEVHILDVDSPTVRFLLDARGEAQASPEEIDLRTSPGAAMVCLVRGEDPTDAGGFR